MQKAFTICPQMCHGKKCCPKVRIGKKFVTITDDFGGKIKLTLQQYNTLINDI